MVIRTLTRLGAALAVVLFAPATPAHAALPQQSAVADLAAPNANPLVHGSASNEQAGTTVAAAGDLNGDGLGDVVVGAPTADANGRTDSGTAYVVYGRSPLAARTSLGSLSATTGYRIDGALTGDRLGTWVAAAGDVNGDGRPDIAIGAPLADPGGRTSAGAAYVITDAGRSARLDLHSMGDGGYVIEGAEPGDRAGTWIGGGGDVDGDGRDDVVVGAPYADPSARTSAGAAYVVRGRDAGGAVALGDLGDAGFAIAGGAAGDEAGPAAIVPDTTGDARAEVLVGAPRSDPAGRVDAGSAWLVAGRTAGTTVDLAAADAGARIDGPAAGDLLGSGVASSPDVTGDGRRELIVGATGADPHGRTSAGSLHFLAAGDLPASTDLAATPAPLRIDGAAASNAIGVAVSGGGDLNDDGRADLAVGDPRFDHASRTDAGAAFVLYGGELGGVIDLAAPPAASTRAVGSSYSENAGGSLAWTRDSNGDGRDDLIVGAGRADISRSNSGTGYVLLGFGAPSFTYPSAVEATARAAASATRPADVVRTGQPTYTIGPALPQGMALNASTGEISGTPVSLLDEPSVHKLTMTDLAGSAATTVTLRIAPAPGACANERPALGGAADVFTGSIGGDLIRSGAGNDTVDARDGDDCVYGEGGDDTLTGGAGGDQLHGGSEHDVVSAGEGNDVVTGEGGNDQISGGSGSDDLRGGGDLDTLRGGDGDDVVAGDDMADSLFGEGGDDTLSGGEGADTLDGGEGADALAGDNGDDRLDGAGGSDELHGGDGVDEILGGAGDDRAWADLENDFLDGGDGNDELWAGAGRDSSHGGAGDDRLFGDADDDDLFGDAGADELHGGAHQDELRGGAGDDTVSGDDGQDLVDGEAGNDLLFGGAGWDHITGDAGDDRLVGGDAGDILDGGAGTDALDGGPGDDRLLGGAGDDVIDGGAGKDTVVESAGRDRISTGAGNDDVTVRRGGGAVVDLGAGSDIVVAFNGKRDTIVCGAGRDTAYVDRADSVKGCEKRIHAKPLSDAQKKKRKKKSSRSRR